MASKYPSLVIIDGGSVLCQLQTVEASAAPVYVALQIKSVSPIPYKVADASRKILACALLLSNRETCKSAQKR
jgi:hypothetical protein